MAFDSYFGACTNVDDQQIYLCFNYDSSDSKKCRTGFSPVGEFEQTTDSLFTHDNIRLASSKGKLTILFNLGNFNSDEIVAVGAYFNRNKFAEVLKVVRNTWSALEPYPYGKKN